MKKALGISFMFVLALAALAGCSPGGFKGVDSAGNRYEVQRDTVTIKGEDVNATISTGGNLAWPKDMMGDLPELRGNIMAVVNTPDGASVTYNGISKSDYDAYVSKVKGQGYETAMEMALDKTTMLFVGQKGDNSASIQLHLDGDSGKGNCVIIYGKS